MEHFLRQGLISDSKVLDIRQVDVCTRLLSDKLATKKNQLLVLTGFGRQNFGRRSACFPRYIFHSGNVGVPKCENGRGGCWG